MRYSVTSPGKGIARLLLLSAMSFLFILPLPVWAGYVPPSQSRPIRTRTTTTGIRGNCTSASSIPLTAIAPKAHSGQTTLAHPTVYWYVPDAEPMQMQFILEKIDQAGNPTQLWETDMTSQSGLMALTLPPEAPALEVGQDYRWKAVLLCNPNRPSGAIITSATMQRIATLPDVDRALGNEATRANLYAENSIWYDAFSLADDAGRRSLLKDLSQLELSENAEYSELLQSIAAALE
jgi:Domain of Unknown Function (DUF928)